MTIGSFGHRATIGAIGDRHARGDRAIAHWLLAVAALIFSMVVLGGLTRLTESGLSIVEWQPLIGTVPPLSDAAWDALFERYKQFPEYQKVNLGMTLESFKEIFWLEYAHRLLGRIIGIAFLAPFVYFLIRSRIRRSLVPKLAIMFVLGAAQGALGWYMVKSGLVDRPDVSAYRLAAHLALAVVIYLYMIWVALGLLARGRETVSYAFGVRFARAFAPVVFGLGFVTLLAGAFVAGNDAGFAYNTFPLMEGRLVPDDLFIYEPWWRNWFESVPLVQLDHRLLAMLTVIAVVVLFFASGALSRWSGLSREARRVLALALVIVAGQFGLGVATLLLVVPIPLAAAHQAGALLLLTALLWACHALRRMSSHAAGAARA